MSDTRAAARRYIAEGLSVIPIPKGEKGPRIANWQKTTFDESAFGPDDNIGVRLGEPSGDLHDVDLDCLEAVAMAPVFLAPTQRIHGRPSKPQSHYFYYCAGLKPTTYKDGDGHMILEVRGAGQQTVLPPSFHPSGEQLAWEADREPARVGKDGFLDFTRYLATASLLARFWPPNGPTTPQHDLAGYAAGFLAARGVSPAIIERIIFEAAKYARDENPEDRRRFARDTADKFGDGSTPIAGGPKLAEIIGEKNVKRLREWFGTGETSESDERSKDRLKRLERAKREIRRELDAEERGPAPTLSAVAGDQMEHYEFPLREPVILRAETVIFRAGHLAQIFAERGLGKTWLLMTLALLISTGGMVLGLHVPDRRRVLYIDGEMASHDIRNRLRILSAALRLPLTDHLVVIGADWQTEYLPRLDTPEGQLAVAPFVEPADVVFLDNRSCLFDPEGEKDASAWQPAGEWLLGLRKAGKGVIVAHHANRQGDARGHSKAEDPMDLVLKLTRPDDYNPEQGARFLVEFVKGRGIYGPAATAFIAALTPDGWQIEIQHTDSIEGRIAELLQQLEDLDELPKSVNAVISKITGKRETKLAAFAAMVKRGEIQQEEGRYRLAPRKDAEALPF